MDVLVLRGTEIAMASSPPHLADYDNINGESVIKIAGQAAAKEKK